jgi:hypothetical protein
MELKLVVLALAQIYGYESLPSLNQTELQHAEGHTTALLEALMETIQSPLTVSKLDGDGLLLYAEQGQGEATPQAVVTQLPRLVRTFDTTLQSLITQRTCRCTACLNLQVLHFALVVHAGEVVFKQIRQFHELAGENMIRSYQLMRAAQAAGDTVTLTYPVYQAAPNWVAEAPKSRVVEVPGLSAMPVWVYDLVEARA